MLHTDTILALESYARWYPEEDIADILAFVRGDSSSVHRSNRHGHVTASGLLLRDGCVLLVYHNALQRYLQPGGHLESSDRSLRDAALREIREETGLEASRTPLAPADAPLHVDTHRIPANPNKGEPAHWHYDCIYLFAAPQDAVRIDPDEASGYCWRSLDDEFTDRGLTAAVGKVKQLLARADDISDASDHAPGVGAV